MIKDLETQVNRLIDRTADRYGIDSDKASRFLAFALAQDAYMDEVFEIFDDIETCIEEQGNDNQN